jgi:ABC-2 type transport system ATP-binding protein
LATLGVSKDAPLKALSKGTKEKVQLIAVMARRALVYLLDEPIGGVDPAAREFIIRTILTRVNEGATIIISTHLIRDIEEILDEYIFINGSKIVAYGSVTSVRNQGKTVDELFREVFRCY